MSDRRRDGKSNIAVIAALLVVVVGLAAVQLLRSKGVAPAPASFMGQGTLDDAIDRGRIDGRVVLAVATADWCAPCQSYKRGPLADARVQDWIDENAIAVMVDVDQMPDDARRLMEPAGVRGIPATFLLHDGEVIAHFTGARDAVTLREWLTDQTLALR